MPNPTIQSRIQIITSAELLDLAENLRRIGFVLDTGQYLRAHQAGDLLLALDLEGRLDSVERLRTVLAPIFCGTPDEQETFYAFFDEWLARNPQIIARIGLSQKDAQPFVHEPRVVVVPPQPQQRRKQRKWWVGGIGLVILTSILLYSIYQGKLPNEKRLQKIVLTDQIIDASTADPVQGVEITILDRKTSTDSLGFLKFNDFPNDTIVLINLQHSEYLPITLVRYQIASSDSVYKGFLGYIGSRIWKNLGPQILTARAIEIDSRTPLPFVNVTFLNETKITDRNGVVAFSYQPKDSAANISSQFDGYLPGSKSIPIHGHGPSYIEIQMKPRPPAEVDSLHSLVGRINKYAESVQADVRLGKWQQMYRDNFSMIRMAGLALPFALFVLWWFSRWLRRRMLLERQTTTVTPKTGAVVVKGVADYLFRNTAFRRTVQQLRQHREVGSTDLNAPATVDATLRCGGLFTPVFASRFISPEYLILIDRASFGDQHAGFIDALVKRMVSDGVIVDRYYFDRDPRICQPENLDKPHSTIQELFVRHPKHRLLIFSDAAGFLDTLTGRPHHWLDDFLEWSSSAIFIPERTGDADYLEYALQDFGFSVGPATTVGLSKHLEALTMQAAMGKWQGARGKWRRDRSFPDMLEEHSDLWLDRHPPPEQKIDNLIATLRDFLEPDGFDWLCACAVYPELHWELTLYLATHLKMGDAHTLTGEEQVLVQKCLTDLTRLPWFRQGYMPDWLRLRLVAEMDRSQHLAVRRILDGLLKEANRPEEDRPPDGFTLPFAHKSLATLKAAVLGKLGMLSDESPLDDYVFANYMSGGKPGRLAVFVPEAVKKLFFRDGQTVLGMRPFMALLLAGAFCGLNGLGLTAFMSWIDMETVISDGSLQLPELVLLQGGAYNMGSKPDDNNSFPSERPQHRVIVSPFAIGKYEVTNAQFIAFLADSGNQEEGGGAWLLIDPYWTKIKRLPSGGFTIENGFENYPVVGVSWFGARAYCNWLTQKTGFPFRLPTEAEWEYACRAGTDTQYSFGNDSANYDQYGWFLSNSSINPHEVGQKAPNEFGLYDMHGNMWEWCLDAWRNNYQYMPRNGRAVKPNGNELRVVRGGSWYDPVWRARSTNRYNFVPNLEVNDIVGFRVVASLSNGFDSLSTRDLSESSQEKSQGVEVIRPDPEYPKLIVDSKTATPGALDQSLDVRLENKFSIRQLQFTLKFESKFIKIHTLRTTERTRGWELQERVFEDSLNVTLFHIPNDSLFPDYMSICKIDFDVRNTERFGDSTGISLANAFAVDCENRRINLSLQNGYVIFGRRGDLNADGDINLTDLDILNDIILSPNRQTSFLQWVGDLDNNGILDGIDFSIIIEKVIPTQVQLPTEQSKQAPAEPDTLSPNPPSKMQIGLVASKSNLDLLGSYRPLRSTPDTSLTHDEIDRMVEQLNFYDQFRNPRGKGYDNQFELRVVRNGAVVLDRATGLMWQQSGSDRLLTIAESGIYILDLNKQKFAGVSDWRLPTLEEALSLMEPKKMNGVLNIDQVFDPRQSIIWTADRISTTGAWNVNFVNGYCSWLRLNKGNLVRAVRSLNAPSKTTPDQPQTETLEAFARRMNNAMALIPAGRFLMGSDDGASDELPVHTVKVDSFYMDKYEVTVAQYKRFLDVNPKHRKPIFWKEQLQNFRRPVIYVSWRDAKAYADWAGKRLPTESEWEYTARGGFTGLDGKPRYKYPWGDAIVSSRANYYVEGRSTGNWQKDLRRVGTYPPNGYGLYDMAGNVSEWCADWYDAEYYKRFAKSSVVNNPVGPEKGVRRVLRDSSWYYYGRNCRTANRNRDTPDLTSYKLGFRVVLSAQ